MGLNYIGKGSWWRGVPARNLSPEEVEKHGREYLLKTGLYAEPKPAPKEKKPQAEAEPEAEE